MLKFRALNWLFWPLWTQPCDHVTMCADPGPGAGTDKGGGIWVQWTWGTLERRDQWTKWHNASNPFRHSEFRIQLLLLIWSGDGVNFEK